MKRFTKGSAVVEEYNGNAHCYVSHGSTPYTADTRGTIIENADARDMAHCLLVFALRNDPDRRDGLYGVTIEDSE
jgi:hypothetical protein